MKTRIFTILFMLVSIGLVNAQPKLEIPKLPAGVVPAIDGFLDETDPWNSDALIPLELVVAGSTTSAASSRFQILHNDEFIYIVLVANDATPNNSATGIPNEWERDNIEIFFHMNDSVGMTYVQGVTSQIRFQRNGEGTGGTGIGGTGFVVDRLVADTRFEWAIMDDGSIVTLEVAFPIATLNNAGAGPFDGRHFFFDIKYADNTTGVGSGRTQQNYWGDPDDMKWSNPSTFSPVALSQTATSISDILPGIKGSIFVAGDMLNFRNIEGVVRIFSITGALLKTDYIDGDGSIDISSLKSGIYIVNTEMGSVKIVK